MANDTPQLVRKLSPYEQFSSSRHKLGLYHCVVLTARYQHSQPHEQGSSHPIFHALTNLIRKHGMLRVGIVDDVVKPYYCHVPKLDLSNHVEFESLTCESQDDYEMKLAQLQGSLHDKKWKNMAEIPPWRITIVTPVDGKDGQKEEDFMFAFHHSLMDGAAARLFHQYLVAALDYPSCAARDKEADMVLHFLAAPDLPPSREDLIPQNLSKTFIAGVLYKELAPNWAKATPEPYWRGEMIDFSKSYKTTILPVEIKIDTLKVLLAACRTHKTTMTGLIHALVLGSLAQRTSPETAPGFKSVTVIDCRSVPPVTANKEYQEMLASCVSVSNEKHSALAVSAFRSSGHDFDELIWSNADRIRTSIATRKDTLPQDDPIMLLKWVSDMDQFFHKKDGTERDETWEVSNLGVLKSSPLADSPASHGWKITRAMFSNAAAMAGPAIGVNMVSVPEGSLVITLSYDPLVVTDELMEGLAFDLNMWTSRFVANGKFSLKGQAPGLGLENVIELGANGKAPSISTGAAELMTHEDAVELRA